MDEEHLHHQGPQSGQWCRQAPRRLGTCQQGPAWSMHDGLREDQWHTLRRSSESERRVLDHEDANTGSPICKAVVDAIAR
jgi:hypothetical protein